MPNKLSALEHAHELTPLLLEHRVWGEVHARMAPEVHAGMAAAELFASSGPTELGAREWTLPEEIQVAEQIAFADPSAA